MEKNIFTPYKNSNFVTSCTSSQNLPKKRLNEILFVGRSNVGKSSIINALLNRKNLAYISQTPGCTRLLNYYLIENNFYFVDSPGYGFSQKKKKDYYLYSEMLDSYLSDNFYLKGVIFLLDSRRIPTEDDITLYKFLNIKKIPFNIVLTKIDKLNMSKKSKIKANLENIFDKNDINKIIYTSILIKDSLFSLKECINNFLL